MYFWITLIIQLLAFRIRNELNEAHYLLYQIISCVYFNSMVKTNFAEDLSSLKFKSSQCMAGG